MDISFGPHIIRLHSCQSKNEMIDLVSQCERGSFILGETPSQEMSFYVAEVHLSSLRADRFGVGICSEGHGLVPNILLQPDRSALFFGFNSSVARVKVPSSVVDVAVELDGLFYSFLPLEEEKMILALHELGVAALTIEGKLLWKFSEDIVTNFEIDNHDIVFQFMDSSPVRLRLSDGKIL